MSMLSRLFGKKRQSKKDFYCRLRLYSMRKVGDKSIFKIEKRQIFYSYFRELLKNMGFGDVGVFVAEGFVGELPVEELAADVGEALVDGLGFGGGFGVEDSEAEAGAVGMKVGEAFECAVAGDDAFVVAGGEDDPAGKLAEESAGFGGAGVFGEDEPGIEVAGEFVDGIGDGAGVEAGGFEGFREFGGAEGVETEEVELGGVDGDEADAFAGGGEVTGVEPGGVELPGA